MPASCFLADGVLKFPEPKYRTGALATKTFQAINWMMRFASDFGDKLPDTVKIQLPMCVTRKTVYEMMTADLQDEGEHDTISYSHFIKIWRTNLKYIIIPKISKFSKCDKCMQYKNEMSKTMNKAERQALREKRNKHLLKQREQRLKYYKHISKSKRNPEKYASIIIDGMDQNKTSVPYMSLGPKCINQMWKLRVHLTAAIVHGHGVYGFFDYNQYKHDSNLTIHVLIKTLCCLEVMPDVLYLQLDNTVRENKNKYVLGFLYWLVELGIIRKIKVGFLMVGHTHEDIDRTFSSFSKKLNHGKAMTLSGLMDTWVQSQSMPANPELTQEMFNYSNLLLPLLTNLEGHSRPHSFKIIKVNGMVQIKWKHWPTDMVWNEIEGHAALLIGKPNYREAMYIPSNLEKIGIEKLENDLTKITSFLTEDEQLWWQHFITSAKTDVLQPATDKNFRRLMTKPRYCQKRKSTEKLNEDSDDDMPDFRVKGKKPRGK